MIKSYLLIAYRNLARQFTYSFINIVGLAIGIACSLVIFLYVYGEWSSDKHFANADRVYRIGWSFYNIGKFAVGPEALLENLSHEFDGIETGTRIKRVREMTINSGDKVFAEPSAYYVDSTFFRVFSYSFIQGDPGSALKEPHSLVLTESMASKFFGSENAMGKTLEIGKEKTIFRVTGIVADERKSAHLKSGLWLSIHDQLEGQKLWTSVAVYNYFLLKENVTEEDLTQAMDRFLEKQVYPTQTMGLSLEDWKKNANSVKYFIQPLEDIYLQSKLNFEISPGGNEDSLYIFGAISVFILLLAAVNFVNLTTARASRRAREVGIRKSLGTSRFSLMNQFLIESMAVSLLAMLLSLSLAELFLVAFELITGTQLLVTLWDNYTSILLFVIFALGVGLLSGIYPAFYLTAFNPVKVLKGNFAPGGGKGFRNVLVVFQFSISICLICCTGVILQQLRYMSTTDLGFVQDHVLTIDGIEKLGGRAEAFRNELMQQTGVTGASLHSGEPGSNAIMSFYTFQTAKMEASLTIFTYFGDRDYIDVMGYQLIKGELFSPNLKIDTTSLILNEAAVSALNLGPDPIGAVVNRYMRVIGVVRDFHWESLRSTIAPVAIMLSNKNSPQLALKFGPENTAALLTQAEEKWKAFVPDEPFKYHFLDENFGALLRKESVFGNALSFFTVLAIFISCLGLYGLAAFTSEQRTREIGIRKVMGASTGHIVLMLNSSFAKLVFLSVLISIPAAYFVTSKWLEGFAYKTTVAAWIFIVAATAGMIIAILTVSYHSLKAALLNPVETLKYE